MFETLMKAGSHRVDYLNTNARGKAGAFAFYVCGELSGDAAYSASAKHSLFTGLNLIQQTLGHQNLVAVYLDVHSSGAVSRPAFAQMKEDMRRGMFRRIVALRAGDLIADARTASDLSDLFREIGGFDLLTFEQGVFKPLMLMGNGALA